MKHGLSFLRDIIKNRNIRRRKAIQRSITFVIVDILRDDHEIDFRAD